MSGVRAVDSDGPASGRHIHTVGGILVGPEGILLGLRSARRRACPLCWDVIGGHVEAGETPSAALIREVREEIGVDAVDPLWLHDLAYWTRSGKAVMLRLFRVTIWAGEPRVANDEHAELRWFAPLDAARLPAVALDGYRAVFAGLAD